MNPPDYFIIPARVFTAWPNLSGAAKAIVGVMAFHMNGDGECYPSRETLKKESGLRDNHTIAAAVLELQRAGVIESQRRPNMSTVYRWPEVRKTHTTGLSELQRKAPGSAPVVSRRCEKSALPLIGVKYRSKEVKKRGGADAPNPPAQVESGGNGKASFEDIVSLFCDAAAWTSGKPAIRKHLRPIFEEGYDLETAIREKVTPGIKPWNLADMLRAEKGKELAEVKTRREQDASERFFRDAYRRECEVREAVKKGPSWTDILKKVVSELESPP